MNFNDIELHALFSIYGLDRLKLLVVLTLQLLFSSYIHADRHTTTHSFTVFFCGYTPRHNNLSPIEMVAQPKTIEFLVHRYFNITLHHNLVNIIM